MIKKHISDTTPTKEEMILLIDREALKQMIYNSKVHTKRLEIKLGEVNAEIRKLQGNRYKSSKTRMS